MKEEEIKKLHDDMSRTLEEFRKRNDAALEDAKKNGGEVRAELSEKIDRANADITAMRQETEKILQRMRLPEQQDVDKAKEQEIHERAFVKFLRHGKGENSHGIFTPEELRTLSGATDSDGGFLIPAAFESTIIMNSYNLEALRPICQVGKTGRDRVKFGSLLKPVVAWGRKMITVTAQSLASGGITLQIHNIRALATIPNDTLDDAEADIVPQLTSAFGRATAEAKDDAFSIGVGDDSPQGVATTSAVIARYKPSGVTAALFDVTHNGFDPFIDCIYALKSGYRRNATWAMNSQTEAAVRKLTNGNGDYIWQKSTAAGAPPTIEGRPIVNPEGMPDIGAGTFPIVCGDFMAGYKIRTRAGLSVIRLTELYSGVDEVGFQIKERVGGMVTLPEAFYCIKIATS